MNVAEAPDRLMPTIFIPHGGGPWPFMDESAFGGPGTWVGLRGYLEALGMSAPEKPDAVLVVSAHWEAPVPTVQSSPQPSMLYDYYGFPAQTYELQYPAPGAPEWAARVRDLLESARIATAEDSQRGFDHGHFVPMMISFPEADVPTFQLSLKTGLDPLEHLRIGRALAPLRGENVLIVGSGMSYHNLRAFGRGGTGVESSSRAFDEWLAETVAEDPSRRET
ncbi:MAG: dioxygenase, partial [Myxococcales bacterium]|nr:dioxygenase [Myxococcales bacterium]